MPNELEMIKLVRADHVAQAIDLFIFRKIFCGCTGPYQYSQDFGANEKHVGCFGLVDFVALKAEKSGRMA